MEVGSPLQGLLSKVLVKKGQKIKANEPLFIIEAMKMETTATSAKGGTVARVVLSEGQMVMTEDLVIEFS
ncbi:MAG: pyruvate carboxylase [Bacteroidia bacterium]